MPALGVPSAGDLYSLSGTIQPTRLSWTYRAGLVVVALAMVILPLLYVALIVATGSAVWWHITENTWIVTGRGNRTFWRLIAYAAPALAGCVLMFFMIKPVLARPARRVDPIAIDPDAEPDLFRFVTRICEQVRAPAPSRIQADCQINAGASFTSSLARPQRRFVLTIGLPLVAGLTIRQFGGVLAHEFAHFAQGGGLWLTFLVRSINGWFARVVHERDRWDQRLDQWANESNFLLIQITLLLAHASIWCSRRVLYILMLAGHGISCFMLRQMEYDADSYEIKLVGSAAFIDTSARLRELNAGAQLGYHHLREGWLRGTLPSNLPAFLVDRCSRLPQDIAQQARRVPDWKSGRFDTHPADADRVRAAEQANASGILEGGDAPAALLFHHFEALSAATTMHHYEHDLGLSLASAMLVDTDVAVTATQARHHYFESAQTFFGEHVSVIRPVHTRLSGVESLTASELIERLLEARRAMTEDQENGAATYREYETFERRLVLAKAALVLFEAGFTKVKSPEDFELARGTLECANEAEVFAGTRLRRLEPVVQRLDDVVAARFACALALLQGPPDAGTDAQSAVDIDGEAREAMCQEAARLIPTLLALADAWPHLNKVQHLRVAGMVLSANLADSADPAAGAKLTGIVDRIRAHLGQMRTSIGVTAAPDSETGTFDRLSALLGLESTLDTEIKAANVSDAALSIRAEVMGRLAAIALQVEAAVDRKRTSTTTRSV